MTQESASYDTTWSSYRNTLGPDSDCQLVIFETEEAAQKYIDDAVYKRGRCTIINMEDAWSLAEKMLLDQV
jgi:hypothetical protein